MPYDMLLWPVVVALAAIGSWRWLESQPIRERSEMTPAETSWAYRLVGFAVGIVLRPGIRFARGRPLPSVLWSFVAWTVIGEFALLLARPHLPGLFVAYGVLSGALVAGVLAVIAFVVADVATRRSGMSNTDHGRAALVMMIGVAVALLSFVVASIWLTVVFYRLTRTA